MKKVQDKVNVIAPDATYPFGDIKNNDGSNNGTPVDREMLADYVQFFEKMFSESGITANGLPDNDLNGFQIYEAFRKLTKPYKSYAALISQTGTNAPVVTVKGFNEIGNIVWSRSAAGIYTGTLTGAFGPNTVILTGGLASGATGNFNIYSSGVGVININTTNLSGTYVDGQLTGASFEIRVYD